jgi:hypothetical protein
MLPKKTAIRLIRGRRNGFRAHCDHFQSERRGVATLLLQNLPGNTSGAPLCTPRAERQISAMKKHTFKEWKQTLINDVDDAIDEEEIESLRAVVREQFDIPDRLIAVIDKRWRELQQYKTLIK